MNNLSIRPISGYGFSSIKYTGVPVVNRFLTTQSNQELVTLLSKDNKIISSSSITIEAGNSDLYFSIKDKGVDINNYDWEDDPVYFCAADTSVTISGISISYIKFSNNSGAQYFIQALG